LVELGEACSEQQDVLQPQVGPLVPLDELGAPLLDPFPPWLVEEPLELAALWLVEEPPLETLPLELPPSWFPVLPVEPSAGSHSPAAEQDWPAGQSAVVTQGMFCRVLEEQEKRSPRQTPAANWDLGNVFRIRRPLVPHDEASKRCNEDAKLRATSTPKDQIQ
jgi:hypothetical protein